MTSVEYAYNPDQPRVPAGAPEGGQWTATAAAGPGDKEIARQRLMREAAEIYRAALRVRH